MWLTTRLFVQGRDTHVSLAKQVPQLAQRQGYRMATIPGLKGPENQSAVSSTDDLCWEVEGRAVPPTLCPLHQPHHSSRGHSPFPHDHVPSGPDKFSFKRY